MFWSGNVLKSVWSIFEYLVDDPSDNVQTTFAALLEDSLTTFGQLLDDFRITYAIAKLKLWEYVCTSVWKTCSIVLVMI